VSDNSQLDLLAPAGQDTYEAWRSAADAAAQALAAWAATPGLMRSAAYRTYLQALDREEDCAAALEGERQKARLLWWLR
jgi:acyl-CoA reductase-like NAD-dependent aldehyde dehydrogenase